MVAVGLRPRPGRSAGEGRGRRRVARAARAHAPGLEIRSSRPRWSSLAELEGCIPSDRSGYATKWDPRTAGRTATTPSRGEEADENTANCGGVRAPTQHNRQRGRVRGDYKSDDKTLRTRNVFCPCVAKAAHWDRARSPGFDRIHITNVFCRAGNTAVWQLWAAVLVLWLGHWAAYRIIDAHDLEAQEIIREAADGAPAHHYAVVCTGLPEELRIRRHQDVLRERVPGARGRRGGRAVPPPRRGDARRPGRGGRRAARSDGGEARPRSPRRRTRSRG